MRYVEPIFRPPSEAHSYLLHVSYGCSHNACSFCAMYLSKQFRVRPLGEVEEDIEQASRLHPRTEKVFLLDGDAMTLQTRRLEPVLDALAAAFPRLRRVGAYSNASSVLSKSDAELTGLREKGLGILYFGLESGDEPTLERMVKGATRAEIIEAIQRANAAGIKTSVMGLLGIAGRARWREHAEATASAVNEAQPRFFSLLTVTPVEGTPLFDQVARGDLELPDAAETLEELEAILARLECRHTFFACNHASNYLPITGRLPNQKEDLLAAVRAAREGHIDLKPEWLRGL